MSTSSIGAILASVADDLRGSPRLTLLLPTSLEQQGRRSNARILNISRSGMLLQSSAGPIDHDEIDVNLPELGSRTAKIVWQSADLAGCQFDKPLRRADLAMLTLDSIQTIERPDEPIGIRIKRLRESAGLSMQALADAIGTSKPTVWKWETGKMVPSRAYFIKLCSALGVGEVEMAYGTAGLPRSEESIREAGNPVLASLIASSRQAIAKAAGVAENAVEINIREL